MPSRPDPCSEVRAERVLASPLWWLALAVLILNDHVFKGGGLLPDAITGKLSDVAGLLVAPPLCAAILALRSRRALIWCFAAVGMVFAAINVSPAAARAWEAATALAGIGWRVWCDPTDLLTLPALLCGWRIFVPIMQQPAPWRAALERAAMIVGALACMATSPIPPPKPITLPGNVLAQAWTDEPFFLIDLHTGERSSRIEIDGWANAALFRDGLLYVLEDERLVAIAPRAGRRVRSQELPDGDFYPLLLAGDRELFVMARPASEGAPERVMAFDRQSLAPRWSQNIEGGSDMRGQRALAPVAGAGLVLVPAGRRLVALDGTTGRVLWTHRGASEIRWPVIGQGGVFVADAGGSFGALDPASGTELWRRSATRREAFDDRSYGGDALALAPGRLFVSDGQTLQALDPATGQLRWRRPGMASMAVGDSLVVARLVDHNLFAAFEVDSGRLRWRIEVEDTVLSAPVVADEAAMVLVRPHREVLYGFDAVTGKLRWTFDLDDGERVVDTASLLVRRSAQRR